MNSILLNSVYILMSLALLVAFLRLMKGPSLPDRVVALELIASIVVGFVGVHAIDTGVASLLDVAIVIALMAFLAAVGFARFIERRGTAND